MLLSNYTFEKERERRSTTLTPGCQYGVNTLCVRPPTLMVQHRSTPPFGFGKGAQPVTGVYAGLDFSFLERRHADRYTRPSLQLKMTKWNIAAIFLGEEVLINSLRPKYLSLQQYIKLCSPISLNQLEITHQVNYIEKLWFVTRVCYCSLQS